MTQNQADTNNTNSSNTSTNHNWWRIPLFIVFLAALFVTAKVFNLGERLGELRDWIDNLGALGPVVFMVLYVLATIAAVPGTALTLGAGALFGSFWGVVLVSISSTTGAALCFLISRYFARDAMEKRFATQSTFQKLDSLTKEHGSTIVALTRLVPLFPFNLLNYGFGLTKVPFKTYVFWSWLCMLPGTIVYVVSVDALTKGLTQGRVPWELIITLVLVVIILVLLIRKARNKLRSSESLSST